MVHSVIFIFILLFIFLCVMFLFMKINISFEYRRDGRHSNFKIVVSILKKMIKYEYKGFKKIKFEMGKIYDNIGRMHDFYKENKKTIHKMKMYISRSLIIKELDLRIVAGLGDAYYTGILNGAIWAVTGIAISLLFNNFKSGGKHIDIKADFKEKKFKVDIFCIFQIKIVNIIVIVVKIWIQNYKYKKKLTGGVINERTSY